MYSEIDLSATTSAGAITSSVSRKAAKNLKRVDFAQLEVGDFNKNAFLRHLKYVLPYHIIFKVDKVKEVINILERMTKKSQGNIDTCEIYPSCATLSQEQSQNAQWSLLELMQLLPNISNLIIHFNVTTRIIEHFPKLLRLDITTNISSNGLSEILKSCNCLSALNLLNSDRNLELDLDLCCGLGHLGFSVEKFQNCFREIFKLTNVSELFIAHQKDTITTDWIECVNKVIEIKNDLITFVNIGSKNMPLNNWLTKITFSQCKNLRGINIYNFDFFASKEALSNLIESLPQLKYLNLANCVHLTAKILVEVSKIRKSDEPLELSIEPRLFDEAKHMELRYIRLMKCSKSCDDFIKGAIFMFQM